MLLALTEPALARTLLGRFDVARDGTGYRVDATADIAASPLTVWQTLTDYERLPQFVPGVRSVKVLRTSEEGGRQRLLVEQSGEFRFLFYTRRVAVLLDVVQEPYTRIVARAVPRPRGDDASEATLNTFEGTYTLQPLAAGVRLAYRAHFVPDFSLPPLFGPWAVRWTMQSQFEAMLAEIERRQRAAVGQGPAR